LVYCISWSTSIFNSDIGRGRKQGINNFDLKLGKEHIKFLGMNYEIQNLMLEILNVLK
jgi:hypothetical protein